MSSFIQMKREQSSSSDTSENVKKIRLCEQDVNSTSKDISPPSFEKSLRAKIAINKYELVDVNTKPQCKQLFKEIFDDPLNDSDVCIAIHFKLMHIEKKNLTSPKKKKNSKKSNDIEITQEETLKIENPYRMELKELNFARLGNSRVLRFKSVDMFECLQVLLHSWFCKLNSFSSDNPKKKLLFLTYDIKKTLYLFQFGFHLPLSTFIDRIEWHDLSVAIWLIDPDAEQFDVEGLTVQVLIDKYHDFFNEIQIDSLSPEIRNDDSRLKTIILFYFGHKHWSDKLYKSYASIEMPVRFSLYSLQTKGIRIDRELLADEENRIFQYIKNIEEQIYKKAGQKFNLNSPKEVANLLYDPPVVDKQVINSHFVVKKKSNSLKTTSYVQRTMSQERSTKKLALINLQKSLGNNLPTLIMEWRRLNRAYNQVIMAIKNAISIESNKFSIVYCQFKEWSATGRILMHTPNLINVNKDFNVPKNILDPGKMTQQLNAHLDSSATSELVQLRKLICARENHVLVSADYSQLELRILTHFTNDQVLIETFNDLSGDVFKSIAASWKQIPYENVTQEFRQQAKKICYGIIYGMEDKSLAKELEVTEEEAAKFRKSFYLRYTQIQPFVDLVVRNCTRDGYVETISHRRRYIQNIHSDNSYEYSKGKRQSVNTMIQGSAADIIKLAMISVEKSIRQSRLDASLVMQMYDELMYEVRKDQVMSFALRLKEQMEQMSEHLKVKLPVKVCSGSNWGSLQNIEFETYS